MTAEVVLRYVRHEDVEHYSSEGWTITHDLADCYHGHFGVLMVRPDSQDALTAMTAPARSPDDAGPTPPCPAMS
jgi:hypothetical protein